MPGSIPKRDGNRLTTHRTNRTTVSGENSVMDKPIIEPLPGERLVSYGDRLLWHELGLQMNGHVKLMLSEDEYVATVRRFFPKSVEQNVRRYKSYFNGKHKSMGLRDGREMPIVLTLPRSP